MFVILLSRKTCELPWGGMRHLHASASSQETGHDPDPLHLHPHQGHELACQSYARVTITDPDGATARGCPRHAVAALDGISGAHVDWADSKGLNEWERKALELVRGTEPARGSPRGRGPSR